MKKFHNDLRHSFCTYLYAVTQDMNLVTAQAGHSKAVEQVAYNAKKPKATGEAFFAVLPDDYIESNIVNFKAA